MKTPSSTPRFDADVLGEAATVRPPPLVPGELRLDAELLREAALPSVEISGVGKVESSSSAEFETGGIGLSWDFIRSAGELSLGMHLRAIVEVLHALSALHTDVAKRPNQRVHGAICDGNSLFRRDGRALLIRSRHGLQPQPPAYTAPETSTARPPDQQVDIYAVGAMLMEALTRQTLSLEELRGLGSIDVVSHPFWSRYAAEPLFGVALRALDPEPARRWSTARDFAEAVVQSARGRVSPLDEFARLIDEALTRPSQRVTPMAGILERSHSSLPVSGMRRTVAGPSTGSERQQLLRAVGAEDQDEHSGGVSRRHRRRVWGQT